jgi:hypothetical protein
MAFIACLGRPLGAVTGVAKKKSTIRPQFHVQHSRCMRAPSEIFLSYLVLLYISIPLSRESEDFVQHPSGILAAAIADPENFRKGGIAGLIGEKLTCTRDPTDVEIRQGLKSEIEQIQVNNPRFKPNLVIFQGKLALLSVHLNLLDLGLQALANALRDGSAINLGGSHC